MGLRAGSGALGPLLKIGWILCQNRIDTYDNKINQQIPVPKLTIFDAISFTAEAWNLVSPSTIVSYWSKVDILPSSENIEDYLILPSDNNTDSIQEMIDCFNFDDPLSANDYIEIDLRLQNQDKLADKEIIELVKGKEVIEEEDNQSQVSEDKITMDQAMESIERLQFFLMQEERGIGISESFLHELNKFKRELKKEILCQWLKQKLTPILVK
ncbi:21455_t:CDS:2 [Entrophospora sp. SA101]|nr:21455_t:CDS:2 [Entrophospora sp. SA101]